LKFKSVRLCGSQNHPTLPLACTNCWLRTRLLWTIGLNTSTCFTFFDGPAS